MEPNMCVPSPILFLQLLIAIQHAPVMPFGGTDDFDVSATHVVYTSKDPILPPAWHTKQNVGAQPMLFVMPVHRVGYLGLPG
jgi:hypothetical protein